MTASALYYVKLRRINLKEVIGMNMNLLRAKMALKGDYDLTALMELLGRSRPVITSRMNGETEWTLPEIRKIVRKYDLTEEETVEIFGLRGTDEN